MDLTNRSANSDTSSTDPIHLVVVSVVGKNGLKFDAVCGTERTQERLTDSIKKVTCPKCIEIINTKDAYNIHTGKYETRYKGK